MSNTFSEEETPATALTAGAAPRETEQGRQQTEDPAFEEEDSEQEEDSENEALDEENGEELDEEAEDAEAA